VVTACYFGPTTLARPRQKNTENIAAEILGKVAYVQLGGRYVTGAAVVSQPCQFTIAVGHWQVCKAFDPACRSDDGGTRKAAENAFLSHAAWIALTNWPDGEPYTPDVKPLRDQILSLLPAGCRDENETERYSITASTPSAEPWLLAGDLELRNAWVAENVGPVLIVSEGALDISQGSRFTDNSGQVLATGLLTRVRIDGAQFLRNGQFELRRRERGGLRGRDHEVVVRRQRRSGKRWCDSLALQHYGRRNTVRAQPDGTDGGSDLPDARCGRIDAQSAVQGKSSPRQWRGNRRLVGSAAARQPAHSS